MIPKRGAMFIRYFCLEPPGYIPTASFVIPGLLLLPLFQQTPRNQDLHNL